MRNVCAELLSLRNLKFFLIAMSSVGQANDALFVKQINLHHAKNATALIDGYLSKMHTVPHNSETIVLVQEPWIVNNTIQGLDMRKYNVLSIPGNEKIRTCILTSKSLNITALPQFCDGDTTAILVHRAIGSMTDTLIFCSGYLPYGEADIIPEGRLGELLNMPN